MGLNLMEWDSNRKMAQNWKLGFTLNLMEWNRCRNLRSVNMSCTLAILGYMFWVERVFK